MKTKHWGSIYLSFTLVLLLAAACSNSKNNSAAGTGSDAETVTSGTDTANAGPAWPALALLKTGENPLWFEFGAAGPVLIESPASASLAPFTPWPYARFVTTMQLWGSYIVMAVNRDGFLSLGLNDAKTANSRTNAPGRLDINLLDAPSESNAGEAVLYRIADSGLWSQYTAESFFFWENKPAVLLYRNDFFADLSAPPLAPQVYVLDKASPVPLGADIPALEKFPPGPSWEAEVLSRGSGGNWYYRMKEKGEAQNETAYFRAEDLAGDSKRISFGEWRDSIKPEAFGAIPAYLSAMIKNADAVVPGSIGEIRLISPDFEGQRSFGFAGDEAGANSGTLMYAYCREKDHLAIAVLPDGRGFYSNGKIKEGRPFSLPALPEGFVYTGLALIGNIIAASWEEQQEASIGAAGFMVIAR